MMRTVFVTQAGYARDARLLQQYARDHRFVALMANYGGSMGRWDSGGKSAIWSDEGAVLACAPAAGEALVIADRSENGWSGRVVG